jgi:hypothetical protein
MAPLESESNAENSFWSGLSESDAVVLAVVVAVVADVEDEDVVDVEDAVDAVVESSLDCCICIKAPRIMLERLGLVLPVRPPSVAVVAVSVWVEVEESVDVDLLDVVSSLESRLDSI